MGEKNDPKYVAMTALMDGERVHVANIGRKVKVSEMELIILVNLARVGTLTVFANLDGATGEDAQRALDKHIDNIRHAFPSKDGLHAFVKSATAMLGGERLGKFLAPDPDAEGAEP